MFLSVLPGQNIGPFRTVNPQVVSSSLTPGASQNPCSAGVLAYLGGPEGSRRVAELDDFRTVAVGDEARLLDLKVAS